MFLVDSQCMTSCVWKKSEKCQIRVFFQMCVEKVCDSGVFTRGEMSKISRNVKTALLRNKNVGLSDNKRKLDRGGGWWHTIWVSTASGRRYGDKKAIYLWFREWNAGRFSSTLRFS